MKTKINVICVLIMILIIVSALAHLLAAGVGFGVGFNTAIENRSSQSELEAYPAVLTLVADSIGSSAMAASMDLPGSPDVKFTPLSGMVFVPKTVYNSSDNLGSILAASIPSLLYAVAAVWTIILFLKLIVNVNKDFIFEHRNVTLMRRMGWMLICGAAALFVGGICSMISVSSISHLIHGYEVSTFWELPWTPCLLGLLSLLMAEIWNRAIVMKEEQALTV